MIIPLCRSYTFFPWRYIPVCAPRPEPAIFSSIHWHFPSILYFSPVRCIWAVRTCRRRGGRAVSLPQTYRRSCRSVHGSIGRQERGICWIWIVDWRRRRSVWRFWCFLGVFTCRDPNSRCPWNSVNSDYRFLFSYQHFNIFHQILSRPPFILKIQYPSHLPLPSVNIYSYRLTYLIILLQWILPIAVGR